ncbi:aurora kinase C-like [Sycon ciliatum]|uniref:aurora kinase C-like n=1 Tax=Sycon ciliatum TaxID=27933 RepID=UPI0031F695F0
MAVQVWPRPIDEAVFGPRVQYVSATKTLCDVVHFGSGLGRGRFGAVREVTMPMVEQKAIVAKTMIYSGYPQLEEDVLRECQIGLKLRHPNIVACLGAMQTDVWAVLFLERLDGSSLHDYINQWDDLREDLLRGVIIQVLQALYYMETAKVVHLDLKEDNIIVSVDGHAKVIDFGMARQIPPGQDKVPFIRADMYTHPPEMNDPTMGGVDHKTVMFFLGGMIYRVAVQDYPFAIDFPRFSISQQNSAIARGINIAGSQYSELSPKLKLLLRELLLYRPQDRPTAVQAMTHSWFTDAPDFVEPKLQSYVDKPPPVHIHDMPAPIWVDMCQQLQIRPAELLENIQQKFHWRAILYEYLTLYRRNPPRPPRRRKRRALLPTIHEEDPADEQAEE